MAMANEFMTVHDVAAWFGVSVRAAYAMMQSGVVPSVKIGQRRVVVPRAAWEAWLARQTEAALARCGGAVERVAS